ncbi:MAG TPA: molybdate ABC transporter substrate-binding protein [Pirellulales bacterium]|nr:molybdate ABC transporter substrate-binding protein [Pirellulales bacterium]
MSTRPHIRACVVAWMALLAFGCGQRASAPGGKDTAPGDKNSSLQQTTVRVASASDLKVALDELVTAFHREHPQIHVEPTYGSSGNFYAQLTNHAPFDLFLSADISYPRKLIDAKLADAASEFLYGIGQIVVWVPNGKNIDVEKFGAKTLEEPSVRKIAIANPAHAPYGRAAEAALKSLGLYDTLKDRLVMGDNIAQTAQFVESGAADVGIIALSLALAPAMRAKGHYWLVPIDVYPRLEQGGVIMSWAVDRPSAAAFRQFMLDKSGREILEQFGFEIPGK